MSGELSLHSLRKSNFSSERFGHEELEKTLRECNVAGTIEVLTESEGKTIARFTSNPLESFRIRLAGARLRLLCTLYAEEEGPGGSIISSTDRG